VSGGGKKAPEYGEQSRWSNAPAAQGGEGAQTQNESFVELWTKTTKTGTLLSPRLDLEQNEKKTRGGAAGVGSKGRGHGDT